MTIESYLLYVVIAMATIASPGPGVILTLTNALRYGVAKSLAGIVGITVGMFAIAVLSGSGLGVILATSAKAYWVLKIVGGIYLFYLGIKLLKNRKAHLELPADNNQHTAGTLFFQGLGITLLNPKPIVFFMALFPQFIVTEQSYLSQFLLLALTFCTLIVFIHWLYALCSQLLHRSGSSALTAINTTGGLAYLGFAVALLFSRKSA